MNDLDRKLNRLLHLARQAPSVSPADPAPPFLARRIVRLWQSNRSHSTTPRKRWYLVTATTGIVVVMVSIGLFSLLRHEQFDGNSSASARATELAGDDLKELTLLVSEPPVVPVHQSQAAWLAVLNKATQVDSN